MNRWAAFGVGLLAVVVSGCADRLASMQAGCQGTWTLVSRELPDGTLLRPPSIRGTICWIPIDSRKAHVTVSVEVAANGEAPRTFDYAASVYEISTSAISRKRHLLLRQGYRRSARERFATYIREKTVKGKITLEEGTIRMSHEGRDVKGRGATRAKGYNQVYNGETMIASYPGVFKDTWQRIAVQ